MCENSISYETFAGKLRREGELLMAGDYYTAGAYDRIKSFRWSPEYLEEHSPQYPNPTYLVWGLQKLLLATLCFRLDGNSDRAENRARQGILIVEDVQQHEDLFQYNPRQGWCHEAIGDFQLVAGIGGYEESYDEAAELYRGIENPISWQSEDEFEFFMQPLVKFANSVDYGLDDETEITIRRRSLEDRIAYKRNHYPEIIDRVLRAGNWDDE